MTIGLASEEFDPLDSNRRLIQVHAVRAADYLDMIAKLADMRNDRGVDIMRREMIVEINNLNTHVKLLLSGLARQPADDAAKHFDRLPSEASD